MHRCLVPILAAGGFTALLVPPAIFLAHRLGAVDHPGGRRVNTRPVPRLGGLAIFAGFMGAFFFVAPPSPARPGFVLAGTAALAVGLLDDLRGLKPGVKLLGQIFAAALLPCFGVAVRFISNPWGGMIPLGPLAAPITVLWVVALMNMINLIDGLDGLAAGVSAIAALSLLFLPQCLAQPFIVLLCLLLLGCTLGFLPFNFHPARIFMGDSGAHFLGFILGYITVAGALKGRTALTFSVPFLAFAVPFADTSLAILRRWRGHRPVFRADCDHLHHRLLYLGLTHRQAVLLLYLCSGIFGAGSVFLARVAPRLGVVILLGLTACAVGSLGGISLGVANRNRL
ncbi:MAG: undecaprenyl/decaprenyl-phosphate alpha-N-acetylglucosaminyl 1-phosphate transferase, partial [Firmicutes bacterium]|nr:undecaprenyl/decaprenyl-phosphate alpha-N-acetylglucosaminyl 1-phosphate transferase [Bacillota bacterium]